MNVKMMNPNDLIPYVNNPRKNDGEAVDKVASSIKNFGFKVPIVVDANNEIVAGHTRYKASKKLQLNEVPVIVADDLTEQQVKAFRIADNRVGEESSWDFKLLDIEIESIVDFDLSDLGFDDEELDEVFEVEESEESEEVEEDDYDEEPPKKPITKKGDIWLLGEHRLMCGDSTSYDLETLMNGEKATLGHNDPPYGMKKEKDGVANDNLNYDDLLEFNKKWIENQFKHLKDNGSFYCWGIDEPLMDIYSNILKPMIRKQLVTFRNLITWNKGNGQGQLSNERRGYATADEKCLFVMCGVQGFNNNSDNYFEGWEPLRKYLEEEMNKLGGRKNWKEALGNQMGSHYFTKSQWTLPTREAYEKLQEYARGKAFKKEYEEIKKEYEEIKKEYYSKRAYFDNTHDNMNNVWHINRTPQEERVDTGGHVTPKPLELCQRVIKSSSRKGDIVLDVFGGSGSTLIASEQLNRKCYMMELDEGYNDVIVSRYINFKESDEDVFLIREGKKTHYKDVI